MVICLNDNYPSFRCRIFSKKMEPIDFHHLRITYIFYSQVANGKGATVFFGVLVSMPLGSRVLG